MKEGTMIKTASIFSLFCGIAMLVVWGILLVTGQFPELRSKPFEARFLLGAELLTATALILGGFGLLTGKRWALKADLVALGMLLYCTIFSTGAFGQAGHAPAAIFFGAIATLAFVLCARFVLETVKGGAQ
jgi:hypothetical protein